MIMDEFTTFLDILAEIKSEEDFEKKFSTLGMLYKLSVITKRKENKDNPFTNVYKT